MVLRNIILGIDLHIILVFNSKQKFLVILDLSFLDLFIIEAIIILFICFIS